MKFITFYFSGTGNTQWAVEQFTNMALALNHQAGMFSIDKKYCPASMPIRQFIPDISDL